MIKRITAAFVALALGVALSLVGATAAQAHTGDLFATATCNADGSYTVTYTLTTKNVPNDNHGNPLVGTTMWKVGGQTFAGTPTSATGLNRGPVSSTGNQTITLGTDTRPAGSTQANWAYAWTTWPDGTKVGSDGGDIALSGCSVKDAAASLTVTPPTCTSATTVSWSGLVNATGGSLSTSTGSHNAVATATAGHTFPAGTGVSANGTTKTISYTIAAHLTGNDCLATATLTPATSCTANSTQTPTTSHATLTSGALKTTPGSYSATFTADSGYHFSNNSSTLVINYTIVGPLGYQNTNPTAPCYKTVDVVPSFPTQTGPTCDTAGSLPALPTNQTGITFSWAADGLTMVATPKAGYSFAGGTTTTHLYSTPGAATGYQNTNPNAPCYKEVPVTPSFPNPTGPTCDAAGSLPALPSGQTGVSYSWAADGLTMVASTTPGYVFPDGTVTTHTYSTPADAIGYQNTNPEAPCYKEVPVTPSFPEASGPTCTEGGSLPALPTGQTGIVYTWAPDGLTMVASTTPGYVFPDGTVTTHTYSTPADAIGYQNTDSNAPCYKLVDVSGDVNHTDQTCNVDSKLVGGSITVTITDHVNYVITDSSNTEVPFDSTTGTTGELAPDTYTVAVTADAGYNLTSPSSVQVVVSPYGDDCGHVDASVTAGAQKTDEQCDVDVPGIEIKTLDAQGTLVQGFIQVTVTPGVSYTITNAANDNIPFNAVTGLTDGLPVGHYVVHPTADAGFVLANPGDIPLDILASDDSACQLPTDATVDPSAVQVQLGCSTSGSYTLSSDQVDPTAVIWTVNGSTVSQGTYTVTGAGTYHIVAAPNAPKWGFDAPVAPWDFVFTAPTNCDLKTLALTGTTPAGALVLGGFAVLFGLALIFRAERRRKTARG